MTLELTIVGLMGIGCMIVSMPPEEDTTDNVVYWRNPAIVFGATIVLLLLVMFK